MRLAVPVLLAALFGALALYLASSSDGGEEPAVTAPVQRDREELPGAADPAAAEVPQAAPAEREDVARAAAVSEAPAVDEARGVLTFAGRLVDPEGRDLVVSRVRAVLTRGEGEGAVFEAEGGARIEFDALAHGVHRLAVEAEGYTHRAEELRLPGGGSSGPHLEQDVVLWPADRLPVVVRFSDGRPFWAMADVLGWHVKNLFVNAFQVRASAHLPVPEDAMTLPDETLVTFRGPGGWQNVQVCEDVVGSLELHAPRPLWVGLWVHRDFLRGQVLREGQGEVVFELDPAELFARLATVRLRVVDPLGAPVEGALVTLKADTSAHRRGDLSEVATDREGQVTLERVIPGIHELSILHEGSQALRRVQLWKGEVDLGDFVLAGGPGVRVRVVDASGASIEAFIEIAQYQVGGYTESLYPPNLHRATESDGAYVLPVPDRLSIVRARPFEADGGFTGQPDVGTANHLLDPASLPVELELLVQDPVRVLVEPLTPWVEGHHLEVFDALNLVIDARRVEPGEELRLDLFPGDYVLRRYDERSLHLGDLAISIDTATRTVGAP